MMNVTETAMERQNRRELLEVIQQQKEQLTRSSYFLSTVG
jgi:hypothetical protein